MRMVSVWLPHLPLERRTRERRGELIPGDRPFALVGSEERGLVLTALNAAAMRAGLSAGLGLADARAICPSLATAPAEPEQDAASLVALARWASRYSPSLNVQGQDGLWLDVTGIPHLFGGAAGLLADMAMRFARLGFSARLALTETLGGAHALARFVGVSPTIVPAGKLGEALAPLPVEALRLAETTTRLLRRLGLKRIGQLYSLPRASLERRFHSLEAAEAVLQRLDQALGRREEPRAPLFPAPDHAARLPFPEPLITHEGIIAGLDHLAGKLCHTLAAARLGARSILLQLYRSDGSCAELQAGFSAPTREPCHLLRILEDKADTLDAGFGVDLMVLAALATEPLLPAQIAFAKVEDREPTEPLIDRLANRLSRSAVRRLFPRQSHVPERAQRTRSAFAGPSSWAEPGAPKPPRPVLLLARPEPLDVLAEIPEGPPACFIWRHATRRVVKAEGPERIAPEWWRELDRVSNASEALDSALPTLPPCGGARSAFGRSEGGKSQTQSLSLTPLPHKGGGGASGKGLTRPRDYYRIEDEDGRRYWIFREGLYQEAAKELPSWYLHGMFG
jgi:protein ImuB